MVPHRWAVPGRRRQRALPLAGRSGIAVELRQPALHLGVALGERIATPPRGARRIDLLERPDDRGEIDRGLDGVDLLDLDGVAVDPRVDLPEPRVARARCPLRDRDGDLDRDERGELR